MNQPVVVTAKRNTWARGCLGLVITSWALLAYLGLADAVLAEDTASDSSFTPVYVLIGVATVAAPAVGIEALAAVRRRGEAWLAYLAFGLALLLPTLFTVAILALSGGSWPDPD